MKEKPEGKWYAVEEGMTIGYLFAMEESSEERKKEQEQVLAALKADMTKENLWIVLDRYQEETFFTSKGLDFTYMIRGGELFVSRREKSITKATVELAFQKVLDLGPEATGPKKLNCFGASYLYPIFMQLGIIQMPHFPVLDGEDGE